MALMSRPKLLLLDEPTAGVNPAMVPEVVERLRRANAELGVTLLFIEHNMRRHPGPGRQVHCLARGRLLASGTPDAVRADPRCARSLSGRDVTAPDVVAAAARTPASTPAKPAPRIDAGLLDALAGPSTLRLRIDHLRAGYGRSEILHGIDLRLGAGQSLCLVGPNGAGKSTVLNAVFGMADMHAGSIAVDGRAIDPRLGPAARLARCRMAYVLQDSSIFPDLSVEQNLNLGGYLVRGRTPVQELVETILEQHPRLAQRRPSAASVLSGGERRCWRSRAP